MPCAGCEAPWEAALPERPGGTGPVPRRSDRNRIFDLLSFARGRFLQFTGKHLTLLVMGRSKPDYSGDYGPMMAALTPLQRNYIKAQMSKPFATPTEWCRMAGYYSGGSAARVQAFRMKHDPKIEAAALEYAGHLMHRDGPMLAVSVMMAIARNSGHPRQLHAAEAIADRIGLHRLSEHRVMVEHREESVEAKVERIKQMAALLGIDVAQLLGRNLVKDVSPKQIEGKVEAVGSRKP
jgi:hypothetical protein